MRRHWLLVLLLLCAGCGDDAPPPRKPEAVVPPPHVEPVPLDERVRYAIERLERGPAPLGTLRVPEIHRRNLELAEDDLIALEARAQKALSDPALIARITGMARRNADPWHNVLRVLLGMEALPADLILAWTEPVLATPEDLITLRLEATRVLATISDERAAPILLGLFRRDPAARELAAIAFTALLHLGGEERAEALTVALQQGSPDLWVDAANRIAATVPPGERDRHMADLLAWWCGLSVGGGPRMPTSLPHLKSYPWTQARLATDAAVPGRADGRRSGLVYGPIASDVTHNSGWFATRLDDQFVFPQYSYVFTGKLPAAQGRCMLGQWGYASYVAAVKADLLFEGVDDSLYYTAKHCMLDPVMVEDVEARGELERQLDAGAPWSTERVGVVQRLLAAIPSCDDADVWRLHERVLFEMRPLDVCKPAIEQAYDAMQVRPQDLVPLIAAGLDGTDAADRGVALYLVRRSRDPLYLDALERSLDKAGSDQERSALRRTLTFIYSRGYGIEPRRTKAFVRRYESWLEGLEDREFGTLATGLLDFEEAGEEAFVRGLTGPRRAQFLAAWPRDRRIVPPAVAAAAIRPMGRETPIAELTLMLGRAYYSFPAESVGELEALRRRLPTESRPLVDAAFERVAHRAPFRRRVK